MSYDYASFGGYHTLANHVIENMLEKENIFSVVYQRFRKPYSVLIQKSLPTNWYEGSELHIYAPL